MTELQLNATHVDATLEQVGGKRVTKRMRRDWLLDTAAALGLPAEKRHCMSGDGLSRDLAGVVLNA